MKKIFLLIFCVGLITSLRGQPINRDAMQLSTLWGYPLTIGDNNDANRQIAFNKLLPMDVELDSLARFQIGAIPDQTVWHEGDITIGFYVLTDTLQANNVTLDYSIDFPPQGKIIFDETTGRFKYFPGKADVRSFIVTFTAQSSNKTITQDVKFILMPAAPPEFSAFGMEPVKPAPASTDDYTIIAQTIRKNVQFNNLIKDTVISFSISGKELIFDNRIQNKLLYLSGRSDIYELNIFAEKVIIRSALHFSQTNITIYAKELIFEDVAGQGTASINTSPGMISELTDASGVNGENAGNITLYIQDYKQTNAALRFILIGGKGQSANRNGTPGNGGNGGNVTSTIDVSKWCDKVHGSAGLGFATDGTTIAKVGQHGENGGFELKTEKFTWLHPNFISAVVKHAKDAYMNVYNGFTYDIFTDYSKRITDYKESGEWESLDDELKMELTNAENEMQTVMFRINQNLDYFGNPIGWVPMLSFEVNKLAFEQEIDKAIRVMYLSYWLKNIDGTAQQRIDACKDAVEMVKQELADNKTALNRLVLLIPELQDEAEALQKQIDDLTHRVELKRQELFAKAKSNVNKVNQNNKIAGILKAVAKVAPVVDFAVPGLGTTISGAVSIGANAFSMITNASDTYGYEDAVGGFMETATTFMQEEGFSKIKNALLSIDPSSLGTTYNTVKDAYTTINNTATPLVNGMINLQKVFTQSSTPNDQVQAELNRLMAQSKEWLALTEELNVLNTKKEELLQKLATTFDNIATTGVDIQKDIIAIDGLNRDVFNGNSKRDLRAMQYLDEMERRAKERLLKYHYYMGKAYEYRMLSPYTAELNLSSIFNRFAAIAETNPAKPVLDAQDFQNLKAVYEEQLSTVTKNILDEYNNNRPEMTTPMRFKLTSEDLAALNNGRDINLNIFERGMIPANHENVRIVNFKIYDMKVHIEGSVGYFAYFELLMEHSGWSKLHKNGEIYWFDHINQQNRNPITWGITYDAMSGITDQQEPSYASSSLLYSLLEKLGQSNNIMIYSRPSVWADIRITKNNVISGNTKMVIDSLVFELQYDFVQRPSLNRNLDIYARDIDNHAISLMPYIEVSRTDKSGRGSGRSLMYRTYSRDTDVTLTAPKEYGRYQFVNWTDRYDEVVSTSLSVNMRLTNDAALTANYKYMGAVLKAVDTIYISSDAGTTTVKVENLGSEEMEWSAVSNDSWLRITDGESGVDDGYISLEFDENPLETGRTGSLAITTDDGEQSVTVYVIQEEPSLATGIKENASLLSGTKIYPNPASDKLYIENDEPAEVLVTDALGRFMYHTIIVNAGSIPIGSWNSGLYIVTLKTEKGSSVYKIVKK